MKGYGTLNSLKTGSTTSTSPPDKPKRFAKIEQPYGEYKWRGTRAVNGEVCKTFVRGFESRPCLKGRSPEDVANTIKKDVSDTKSRRLADAVNSFLDT